MGRITFESFPKPLPNRTHVVITRQKNYKVPKGVLVVNSLEKAIEISKEDAQKKTRDNAIGELKTLPKAMLKIMLKTMLKTMLRAY